MKQREIGILVVLLVLSVGVVSFYGGFSYTVYTTGMEPTRSDDGTYLISFDTYGRKTMMSAELFNPGYVVNYGETKFTVTDNYTWRGDFSREPGFNVTVEGYADEDEEIIDISGEVERHLEIHLNVYLTRAATGLVETIKDGVLIDNAGTVTTIGLNWIEDQMGDTPANDPAKWISVSNDAGAPAAGWTEIPAEIAANGLTRAAGTYASTGNGVWTITHTFTASGAQSAQLAGLNYAANGDGNLLCADTFAVVAMIADDTLEVEWTITVS